MLACWCLAGSVEGTAEWEEALLRPLSLTPWTFLRALARSFCSTSVCFQTGHMEEDTVTLYRCYTPGTSGGLAVRVSPGQTVWEAYAGKSSIAPWMTLNGVANLLVMGSVPQETILDFLL